MDSAKGQILTYYPVDTEGGFLLVRSVPGLYAECLTVNGITLMVRCHSHNKLARTESNSISGVTFCVLTR